MFNKSEQFKNLLKENKIVLKHFFKNEGFCTQFVSLIKFSFIF